MRSVFLMSIANIKKKKIQSILMGLTILVASLMFSTSIGIMSNANKPFETMFESQNSSQDTLTFSSLSHDPNVVKKWWDEHGVSTTDIMSFYETNDKLISRGKKLATSRLFVTERPAVNMTQDKLVFVEGRKTAYPSAGEIWMPTGFAYSNGIKVGDTISIPGGKGMVNVKVAAIVVDPQHSASVMDVIRIWVAPGEVSKRFTLGKSNGIMLGLRYPDYSKEQELWKEFEEFLGKPFIGFKLDYETVSFTYLVFERIAGAILLIFAIIIIIVTMFIMLFTISNSVLSDYKVIGIMKSQGFSPGNVVMTYVGQYLILSLVTIPIGVLTSFFMVRFVTLSLIKSMGVANLTMSMLVPLISTVVAVMGTILTTAWLSSKKASAINPAQAIRYGEPPKKYSSKKHFDIRSFKSLSVTLLLSIKQLLANKRQILFAFVSTILTVFVLVFSVNLYNTMLHLGKNYAYWGFDASQVSIIRSGSGYDLTHEKLMKYLENDGRVKEVVPWIMLPNYPLGGDKRDTEASVLGVAYDGSLDSIGVMNMDGRNPSADNEISLSSKTADAYGKKVGDMVEVYIDGKKTTFLVTGIYQSMLRNGWSYRMTFDKIKQINPGIKPSNYAINLKDGVDVEAFMRDARKEFGRAIDIKLSGEDMNTQFSSATGGIAALVILLGVIFTSVTFIVIFNSTLMSINRQKKSFGIFKSFGMTPLQIRLSMVYNVIAISIFSVAAGIPLTLTLAPRILGAMLKNIGAAGFPLDVNLPGTIAVSLICMFVSVFSAWIPTGKILKINPRNLIVE